MSVTGAPDDQPGGGPMRVGPSLADIQGGHFALSAVLAALYNRDVNGGQGQHIDIALLDSIVASISHYASCYLIGREVPIRRGNEGNGGMPQRTFVCSDQTIVIVIGNDKQFVRFCSVIGMPELAKDVRFEKNVDRGLNRKALAEIIDPVIATWHSADLLENLELSGVPCGPVNDLCQVFNDPQIKWRGMEVNVSHGLSQSGTIGLVANPMKFSDTPITEYRTPPMLGEHNNEVLEGVLGLSRKEIEDLRAAGAI